MGEKLIIQGGVPLSGEIPISGAKNSVLKLMAASLLTEHAVALSNVPKLSDVDVMAQMVRHLGREVRQEEDQLFIEAGALRTCEAPYELVSKMRASFIVLGALLGRCGYAKVPLPGGCSIGKRGVDLHVKGLQSLGADVSLEHGYVEAKADRLIGGKVMLDVPSVGATENVMLAAVLAEGATTISNAAQEPEIVDLADFLNAMGADVSGAGTKEIIIHGVKAQDLSGVAYSVVPDRIEAATYMVAAVGTYGDVTLTRVNPTHLDSVISKLQEMGADIHTPSPTTLRITNTKRLKAENIVTQPYPGFPTDLQAPFMAVMARADGVSIITETIYENRFKVVGELERMGAQIHHEGNMAVVTGVEQLSGAAVQAHDLRAGAALIVAGLQAHGQTDIYNLQHIDRGYERLIPKLQALGAHVERVSVDDRETERVLRSL